VISSDILPVRLFRLISIKERHPQFRTHQFMVEFHEGMHYHSNSTWKTTWACLSHLVSNLRVGSGQMTCYQTAPGKLNGLGRTLSFKKSLPTRTWVSDLHLLRFLGIGSKNPFSISINISSWLLAHRSDGTTCTYIQHGQMAITA
jgi:hypothetical protein